MRERTKSTVRRAGAMTAAAVMASGVVVVGASAAQAASVPSATSICNKHKGGHFRVIDQRNVTTKGGTVYGRVYLLYNGTYNCVVTRKLKFVGKRTFTAALIRTKKTDWQHDYKDYKQYAGPRYVYGKGRCVKWGGAVYNKSFYESNPTKAVGGRSDKWNHCG